MAGNYDLLNQAHQHLEQTSARPIQIQVDKVLELEDRVKKLNYTQNMD